MKNKTRVLIMTGLCAAIAVLAGFTVKYKNEADAYRRQIGYAGTQAMSQLADSMNDMSDSLALCVYAYSPELMTSAAARIWNDALSAEASLSSMPLWNAQLERTQTYINQAGDYAYYIAHHAASGTAISDEEREQLRKMAEKTRQLSEALYNTETALYSGTVSFENGAAVSAAGEFEELENSFEEFTFAEYDGKLTGSIANLGAGKLAQEEEIDEDTAMQTAERALNGRLTLYGEETGNIPAYVFINEAGELAAVSKNGGHLLSVRRNEKEYEPKLKASEAIKSAQDYLEAQGYSEMIPVYYQIPDNTLRVEFVYNGSGARAYPDRIKAAVSLYDGTVVYMDASEYLQCHYEREEAYPTETENLNFLPEEILVEYVGQAVVLSPGRHEMNCREYLCRDGDKREFTMYLDTETGEQKLIKLVDSSDYGTFIL